MTVHLDLYLRFALPPFLLLFIKGTANTRTVPTDETRSEGVSQQLQGVSYNDLEYTSS